MNIAVSGGSLVVTVNENQLVNAVVFNGNRKIKDDKLEAAVKTRALGPFDQNQINADIEAIKQAYAAIGRNDVTVTTQTATVGEGRVNIAFVINEGERTKITGINFVGNNAYSNSRLQSVIATKESGIFSFLTRKDVYNEDKLRADEELLRQFYFNRGYADFRVVSSDATLNEATTNTRSPSPSMKASATISVRSTSNRPLMASMPRTSRVSSRVVKAASTRRATCRSPSRRSPSAWHRPATPSPASRRAATATSAAARSPSTISSTRASAPMSSASKSAATPARATTLFAVNSTSAKATLSTRK